MIFAATQRNTIFPLLTPSNAFPTKCATSRSGYGCPFPTCLMVSLSLKDPGFFFFFFVRQDGMQPPTQTSPVPLDQNSKAPILTIEVLLESNKDKIFSIVPKSLSHRKQKSEKRISFHLCQCLQYQRR